MTDLQKDLAACIPSNWCDPLLTGPDAALVGHPGTWGGHDIERLLNGIRERIQHHAAIAEAVRDARRYRWLIENCSSNGGLGVEIFIGDEAPDATDLGAMIDRAREGDHAS